METILIPIDFSEVSKNTAEYGIQFAKERNAKLILFHVFNIPVYTSDDISFMPAYDEFEKSNMIAMEKFEKELREKYLFTNPIENIIKSGFLISEIVDLVEEKEIDLVIIGISEAGKLSEILLSSNSIGVIKNTNCPTLIVPDGVRYRPINTVVFACDDIEKVADTNAAKQIRGFVELFNSKLIVLNVVDSFENLDQEILLEAKKEVLFEDLNYSVLFIEGNDLIKNLNNFIEKNNADLLIMIPKKHDIISRLFNESKTKKMAFNSLIPLLAIHE
ncbi:MAG: universal stress protein [Bacteroidetes bacterium]|nr:universal stress protein [Bacteroidota bacterium]